MIKFDFNGIKIEATVEMKQHDYRDSGGHYRSRADRNGKVVARFWGFTIDGDLTELAFVKSMLNYFMQCYWKRTSKEGSKIELAKFLCHETKKEGQQKLFFIARQKNKKHFLQICFQQRGATVNECYLDGQEVIMLDIAIAKAISLLSPAVIESDAVTASPF
ncbi:hypothetical protein [Geobacter sp.]|uniref:hypothetical protein n=1 Tax=Geobacter sp. TaxID=46610 RepID=UPI00261B42DC|nr:hypothetical protein [Geobacter sp.]